MNKYILWILVTAFVVTASAQSLTEKVINECPEMEIGKVYSGADIRATNQEYFSDPIKLSDDFSTYYAFAKVTDKKNVLVFMYSHNTRNEADWIELHAFYFSKKDWKTIRSTEFIYSDGTINGSTDNNTIQLINEKEVMISKNDGDKTGMHKYEITKTGLLFSEAYD